MAGMAHSRWGASGFSRVIACKGVIRQARSCLNESNPAAELGTAAHELGEFCLRTGFETFDTKGLVFNKHEVDDLMIDAVQLYVSFIRNIALQSGVPPLLEQRVTISSISPDMYGTSDCIFIIGDTLHVYDYKHGYGVVEVENNIQAIYYALGVLDTYGLWATVSKVITGIIQPRADHIDGSIRLSNYTLPEMKSWLGVFAETYRLSNDPNSKLNAGEHCVYCLASGFCKPRVRRTLDLIFTDSPVESLTPDEISIVFRELPAIKRNCARIESEALSVVRSGKSIEGFKLVNAIARAVCKDEQAFVKVANEKGIETEKLYNRKIKSMTDCKKILDKDLVNQYFIKPETSTTLVKITDRRPAVSTAPSAIGKFNSVVEIPSATGKFKNVTEQ